MIYDKNNIPVSLTSLTALNIIYSFLAAIIVGLYSFNDDLWTSIIDKLEGKKADRRDNIEVATIVFLALSGVVGSAFFIFYKHDKDNKKYYERFMIFYGVLLIALTTLTGLQFYYYQEDDDGGDIYQFTRWWPLASLVLTTAIIFALFRFRNLV